MKTSPPKRKTLVAGRLLDEADADILKEACARAGSRPTPGLLAFMQALRAAFTDPTGPLAEAHGIKPDVARKLAAELRPARAKAKSAAPTREERIDTLRRKIQSLKK